MDAQRVVEKILSEARAEAEKIKASAEQQASEQQKKLDSELAEYRKQTEARAQRAADARRLRVLAGTRMDLAKDKLAARRKILDEVFARAGQQVKNLSDGEYRDLMGKLLRAASGGGEQEVIVGKNESRIDQSLIDEVSNKTDGDDGKLRLAEERANIEGGFILRRGKVKVNASIDVLISQARDALEIELAKMLFGSTGSGG